MNTWLLVRNLQMAGDTITSGEIVNRIVWDGETDYTVPHGCELVRADAPGAQNLTGRQHEPEGES